MTAERTMMTGSSRQELPVTGAFGSDDGLFEDSNFYMKQAMLYARDLASVYGEEQARRAELEQAFRQLKKQVKEREAIERALRESEDRYKQLAENSLTGIYVHENETLVYVNSRLATMFDYSPEEMIGRKFWDFVHPDDRKTIQEQFFQSREKDDRSIEYEFRHLCSNGDFRWVEVLASTIRNGGKVTHMGNVLDVTDRKRSEEAMHHQLHFMEILLEAIPGPVFYKNVDHVYLGCNEAFAQLLGLPKERIVGRSVYDVVPKESADLFRRQDGELFKNPGTQVYETSLNRFDGSNRDVMFHKACFFDSEGKVAGLIGVILDITERRQAEEEVKRTRAFLDSIVENLPTAVFLKDAEDLRFVVWNKACEDLYGHPREQVLGKTVHDILPRAEADFIEREDREVLRDGKLLIIPEQRIEARPNDQRILHKKKLPLLDENGEPKYLVCITEDITHSALAKKRLIEATRMAEDASRAKSEFVANMSHEIRTPMNGIIGMTELALNTELTSEQHEYLEGVKSSAEALLMIINDILDLSKIEAKKLELVAVDFNLRDCIADMMVPLALAAQKKGLELAYQVPAEVPEALIGDPGRLRQVLVNLVGNSIKFTSHGEVRVEVKLEAASDQDVRLHFSVTDTGIGIPPEKQDKIFEAFEQVDGSCTRQHGGTGLGLTITSRLVQMMGGQIQVKSEVGTGSEFHFAVNFARQKEPKQAARSKDAPSLKGLRVLIVDDNATNRRILEEIVSNWGMKPAAAADGFEALELISRADSEGHPFSAALIDNIMPGMDGFELAEHVRSNPHGRGIGMIMLTSAGQRGDAARCLNLGISAYLPKPVRHDDLLGALEKTLDARGPNQSRSELVTRHSIRESNRSLRILLVEDNVINQKVAFSILQKMGHHVVVAGDGKKALEALAKDPFDLVLMDVHMPEMDGLEATREIRKGEREDGKHVPIIAMTAAALKGDREQCFEAGMDAYIAKPIDVQELFNMIEKFVIEPTRPKAQDQKPVEVEKVINLVELLERVQGDTQLLDELVALFVEECPGLLSGIRTAIEARDADGLATTAHTLKGCVGNFCAAQAFQAALSLEMMGRSGDLAHATEAFAKLEQELNQVLQALTSLTKEVSPCES